MSIKVQKISVALPTPLTEMVKKAVKSGQYASASEVVREALRGWKERENAKAAALSHMRTLIKAGIKSGPSKYESMEEIIAEAKRRYPELVKKSA